MKRYLVLELAATASVALLSALVAVVAVCLTHGNLNGLAFGAILALLVLGCVLAVASWVAGMVTAAGLHRWDWFVAVLLLGAPAALVVGVALARSDGLLAGEATFPAS